MKNSFSNKIFCSISELHQAFFSIYDIIHNYENFGIDQTNFFIGRYEFILNINDNDLPLPAKDQIEKYFRDFTKTKDTETVLFKDFPESIKNLFKEYEDSMIIAYNTDKLHSISISKFTNLPVNSNYLLEIQHASAKQSQITQGILKNELEWQKQDLKFQKAQSKLKGLEYHKKEENLNKHFNMIKNQRLSVAYEMERLEKEAENLKTKKAQVGYFVKELKALIEDFSSNPENQAKDSENSLIKNSAFNIQEELQFLEMELRDLENQFKISSVNESENIKTQIYRLKTKISSLKSINVVTSTLKNTNTMKNIIKNLSRVYSLSPPKPPSSQASTGFSAWTSPSSKNLNFSESKILISQNSLKDSPYIRANRRSSSEVCNNYKDITEDKESYLSIKEARLKEKEEMINKKEEFF